MKKTVSTRTMLIITIASIFIASYVSYFMAFRNFNNYLSGFNDKYNAFLKFDQVYRYVSDVFVGEYNPEKAMDSAMSGYIEGLGDKWSHYLSKDEYKSLLDAFNNRYTGIGISVQYNSENENLLISQVHENSSAYKAGLQVGDAVVATDGIRISESGYYDAISRIRGETGTFASITVIKKGFKDEINYTLKRDVVKIEAVSSKILDGNIGYIKIDNFDSNVDKNFKEKLNSLIKSGVSGFIFDVRDNGGGSDTVLLPMLDSLLPSGVIFSMKDKKGNLEQYTSDANEINLPMVVIINENSYSAAEFFAAALQELDKAIIVGQRTSGKGFAQSTIPLDDGSGLYLSTRTYYTPKGNSLANVGVTPDVQIEPSEHDAKDIQLEGALSSIKAIISK